MKGFSAEPVVLGGSTVWILKDLETGIELVRACTLSEAVQKLEEKEGEKECSM